MNSNINLSKISSYSQQLVQVLLDSFFADRDKISGEEIMNLSTIRQINLFALKGIFDQWNQESKKLESPFFDYQHAQVVEAIQHFKNTISRHILVSRDNFEPVLEKAIADTLLLIYSPYQYYLDDLVTYKSSGQQSQEWFSSARKFTKINTSILEELIKKIEDTRDFEPGQLLDTVIKSMSPSPEDTEEYLVLFSSYIPLEAKEIYSEEPPTPPAQAPHANTAPEIEKTVSLPEEATSDEEEAPTLNDALAQESHMTLADVHSQQKIEHLSQGITLNQRFMFVNVLFEGDVAKFNNTVLDLDRLATFEDAERYLDTHYSHWNNESYEVNEFRNILERRY